MITLNELARQEYTDCALSSGSVDGHDADTIYLRFERDGEEPTTIYLREDEAMSIIWLLSGSLWSASIAQLEERRACTSDAAGSIPAAGSEEVN